MSKIGNCSKIVATLKSKMTFFLGSHTDLAVYFERYLPFLGTHLNLIYPSGFWSRQAASKQKKGMTRSNGYSLELPHCTLVDINRIYSFEKWWKILHRVLGSCGFQWCGFHLCPFSKNSPNIQLMRFWLVMN